MPLHEVKGRLQPTDSKAGVRKLPCPLQSSPPSPAMSLVLPPGSHEPHPFSWRQDSPQRLNKAGGIRNVYDIYSSWENFSCKSETSELVLWANSVNHLQDKEKRVTTIFRCFYFFFFNHVTTSAPWNLRVQGFWMVSVFLFPGLRR